MMTMLQLPLADLLELWTEPGAGGCRLWIGAKNAYGYGMANSEERKKVFMHRHSWELANNWAIPPGLVIRHKCDVRACINPEHLETGTQAENVRDKMERRYGAKPVAESIRLTAIDVERIYGLRMGCAMSWHELGAAWDCTPQALRQAVKRIAEGAPCPA